MISLAQLLGHEKPKPAIRGVAHIASDRAEFPDADKVLATAQRRAKIVEHLGISGPATIGELADQFDVTADAMHRDIQTLYARGKIDRSSFGWLVVYWRPYESR